MPAVSLQTHADVGVSLYSHAAPVLAFAGRAPSLVENCHRLPLPPEWYPSRSHLTHAPLSNPQERAGGAGQGVKGICNAWTGFTTHRELKCELRGLFFPFPERISASSPRNARTGVGPGCTLQTPTRAQRFAVPMSAAFAGPSEPRWPRLRRALRFARSGASQ